MKKSRRTYNGVHLNKKSNTQDVVEQSLTNYLTSSEITAHSSGFSSKARIQVLDVEESNIIFQI